MKASWTAASCRCCSLIALLGILAGGFGCRSRGNATTPAVVAAMNEGVAHMGQFEYAKAVAAFQKAVDLAPGLLEARIDLAVARFNRGKKEDRDLEVGRTLLDRVLAEEPGNLRALYFRGILLQHEGKAEEAAPCFERVVQQRPDDGAAWYLLALCHWRLGEPAKKELEEAIRHRPYLYSAHYKLSQVALKEGDAKTAKRYREAFKALRKNPLGEAIVLPQYDQMGDLALVRPSPGRREKPLSGSEIQPGESRRILEGERALVPRWPAGAEGFGGVAAADFQGDGHVDLVLCSTSEAGTGGAILLRGAGEGKFQEATNGSGLELVAAPLSSAVGDYDNDGHDDLYFSCVGENRLLRGRGDGTFEDVTAASGAGGGDVPSRSALFLDADHDADLDLLVLNDASGAGEKTPGCRLLRNRADGTFEDVSSSCGLASAGQRCVAALPGDLDGDRDTDLVILREGGAALIFRNELLARFEPVERAPEIHGARGGVLQDFNGDGVLDLVALGSENDGASAARLWIGDGRGGFRPDEPFDDVSQALATWGAPREVRAADIDLDGDLDIVLVGKEGHLLVGDGRGAFVAQPRRWTAPQGQELAGLEVLDVDGDQQVDVLIASRGGGSRLAFTPLELSPPGTSLTIRPTGMRSRDKRTRSPASGYGVRITARVGLDEQTLTYTGLSGGPCQSHLPQVIGLGGRAKADYVGFAWPDGVGQAEIGLLADQDHAVAEIQRKRSSCPVLFAWNGERLEFVTDFAGVGGLGYFAAPGESAPERPLEHIKLEPGACRARDGRLELRVCEPMEETAYVDRLELVAVDHPAGVMVYPDERLALSGPEPTHELLVVRDPLWPEHARGPSGEECVERLRRVDREYAYEPPLDRRFCGFCRPHSLELDFGDRLAAIGPEEAAYLFITGFIEYPYSQTVYAASQARVAWEPIRVERDAPEGGWKTIVPDGGVPGGMGRTMTIPLPSGSLAGARKLRLTTNLEVYWDRVFVAAHRPGDDVVVRRLPLERAELRRLGFPLEHSPDGRLPLLYDYDIVESSAPFRVLRGAYTRYGPVEELLSGFDDRFVLVAPGDEIALRFDARALPPEPGGARQRSFVLRSHAWCKDMDLYTATPRTVEPLPFAAMSRYPVPEEEAFPDDESHRRWRREYNTRVVD